MSKYTARMMLAFFATITILAIVFVFTANSAATPIVNTEPQQEPVGETENNFTEQDFCQGIAFISCNASNEKGIVKERMPGSMQQLIADMTKNVPDEVAIRIAKCESSLNPRAQNPGSSAYGLFQFTKATWENYCEGNITDVYDHVACFDRLYPSHPTWWECE